MGSSFIAEDRYVRFHVESLLGEMRILRSYPAGYMFTLWTFLLAMGASTLLMVETITPTGWISGRGIAAVALFLYVVAGVRYALLERRLKQHDEGLMA